MLQAFCILPFLLIKPLTISLFSTFPLFFWNEAVLQATATTIIRRSSKNLFTARSTFEIIRRALETINCYTFSLAIYTLEIVSSMQKGSYKALAVLSYLLLHINAYIEKLLNNLKIEVYTEINQYREVYVWSYFIII